jgi:hypothetical protein
MICRSSFSLFAQSNFQPPMNGPDRSKEMVDFMQQSDWISIHETIKYELNRITWAKTVQDFLGDTLQKNCVINVSRIQWHVVS